MKSLQKFVLLFLLAACGPQAESTNLDVAEPDVANADAENIAPEDTQAGDTNAGDLDVGDLDAGDLDAGDFDAVDIDIADPETGVGGVSPVLISTTPANGATEVAFNPPITATFSEGLDPLSVSATTVTLKQGATTVPGTATSGGVTVIFTPSAALVPSTVYTMTITTGVQDPAGNALAADTVWSFTTWTQQAQDVIQEVVPLASSSSFAILASAAITNIPTSSITGDVGLIPDSGANISGFSAPATCPELTGTMYAVDATGPACAVTNPVLLQKAKADAGIAFINARAAVRGTPQAISGNLNGLTLYPGLYETGSTLEISPGGFLYLDAQGDGNALFIIRSATSITTEATSEVVLTGGAKAANVYWTAGSAVTLGTNSIMKGTILAGTAISLLTGSSLEGRALNQGAAAEAITLDSCTIVVPSP